MNKRTAIAVVALTVLLISSVVFAASPRKIDREVDETINEFIDQVDGAKAFLDQAAGYLVFPRVVKVGIGVGAESGEGALRIDKTTVDYYRTRSGSIGLQLGAQAKSIVIVFMTEKAANDFRQSNGWKVGVDGSVVLIDVGDGRALDSTSIKDPIVGFVFGSRGLMFNLTLEGSKFSKLDK